MADQNVGDFRRFYAELRYLQLGTLTAVNKKMRLPTSYKLGSQVPSIRKEC